MRSLSLGLLLLLSACPSSGAHYQMPPGCTPGDTVPCACSAGVQGVATCNTDGASLSLCTLCGAGTGGGSSGTGGATASSGTGGVAKVCTPGAALPCSCANAEMGTATCNATGTAIGVCESCVAPDGGGDAAGSDAG